MQKERTATNFEEVVKMINFFMSLAKNQGLSIALVLAFAWLTYQEKNALNARLDKQQEEIVKVYQEQLQSNKELQLQMIKVMEENVEVTKEFSNKLKGL